MMEVHFTTTYVTCTTFNFYFRLSHRTSEGIEYYVSGGVGVRRALDSHPDEGIQTVGDWDHGRRVREVEEVEGGEGEGEGRMG